MATAGVAVVARSLALAVVFELVGAPAIGRALFHLGAPWVAVVALAQLATYPTYILAYRSVVTMGRGDPLPVWTVTRVVIAGFGPVTVSGGFGLDRAMVQALGRGASALRARVEALVAIEWAVLAPVTSVVALTLLLWGSNVSGSVLWPWALGVPLGAVWAVHATRPGPAERLARRFGRHRDRVLALLVTIRSVVGMARAPGRYAGAWLGMSAYWCAEILALYAALRAVGLDLGVRRTVLAYATGYVASRRSLPLGGAGLAEALLICSLWQLRAPLGPATAAVVIYRAFNFLVVIVPSLLACRSLDASLPRASPASERESSRPR